MLARLFNRPGPCGCSTGPLPDDRIDEISAVNAGGVPEECVGRALDHIECVLTRKSTYVDYWLMPRKPNNSRQTRALLAALLECPHTWRHGYDLAKETGLKSGTLYPLLMRLSEQGLLESCWQEAKRAGLPPRHVYRLTASGLALAREQELAAITAERAGALA
jgi:PadR family transcriptional regulator, regulatory protein PadR